VSIVAHLRALCRRRRREADISAELQAHVDALTERHSAAGLSPEEARYAALREFGGVEQIKERCRDERSFVAVTGTLRELRFTWRSLARDVRFTLPIVLTMALCIGATVAIGSVVYAVFYEPLPFSEADRIVVTYNRYPKTGIEHGRSSVVNYLERRQVPAFEDVAAVRYDNVIVEGASERQPLMFVTPSFFRVLGVTPFLGRNFSEDEAVFGHDDLVILGYDVWRTRFDGDPAVIGKTLRIEDTPHTIVGVMPQGFHYLAAKAQLWVPMAFTGAERQISQRHDASLEVIARLRPGGSIARAQQQVDALNRAREKDDPHAKLALADGFCTSVVRLRDDATASVRPALRLVTGGVLLLLVIATVNLANLVLVRVTAKAKEFAVRHALGASRGLLTGRIFSETISTVFVGGLVGVALAAALLRGIAATSSATLPVPTAAEVHAPVVVAALTLAALVGVVIALPALILLHTRSTETGLGIESRAGTVSRPIQRLRNGLVVLQIALAFVLLTCAALLGLSLRNVLAVNPGFQPDHVVTAWIALPWKYYERAPDRLSLAQRWLAELAATPGITSAGIGTSLPVVGEFGDLAMRVEGAAASADQHEVHHLAAVSGDYFAALRIPLRAGRLLRADDLTTRSCVVDDAFARQYWPNGDAVGHKVWLGLREANDWSGDTAKEEKPFTIVGVVGAVKQTGLTEAESRGMVYYPVMEPLMPFGFVTVVRTSLPDTAIVPSLRAALRRVDARLPLDDVRTMSARIDDTTELARTILVLTAGFAMIALSLGVLGVYGVVAYVVAQREREIAIRFALGALKRQIALLFLSLGVRLALLGTVIGAIIAGRATSAIRHLLFHVSPLSPVALLTPAVVLLASALIASLVPSRRASAIDPAIALRAE
jgi:predicted permease